MQSKSIQASFRIFPEEDSLYDEMVYVASGEFMMGSDSGEASGWEKPVHRVKLDSFYMGQYPVTQALWQQVMGTHPSFFQGSRRPVERVSWDDAQAFIQKLNERSDRIFRLSREAEWEYAARGGQLGKGYIYAGSEKLSEVGWYGKNSHLETKPVGLKVPNELGLYDMSGNVWEWCEDLFDETYYQQCVEQGIVANPQGPKKGDQRVMRGGSCYHHPVSCRVSNRLRFEPLHRYGNVGFRLVCLPQ
ncbi:MAG: formylglycine-generating enzyme family protein [Bacteroidota bacterium]